MRHTLVAQKVEDGDMQLVLGLELPKELFILQLVVEGDSVADQHYQKFKIIDIIWEGYFSIFIKNEIFESGYGVAFVVTCLYFGFNETGAK